MPSASNGCLTRCSPTSNLAGMLRKKVPARSAGSSSHRTVYESSDGAVR